MMKRFLWFFLLGALFLVLFSNLASAGCCIYATLGSSCETKNSAAECTTTPQQFVSSDCSTLGECKVGCCCSPGTTSGKGSTNYSCQPPKIFKLDPNVLVNVDCSCGQGSFSISGTITKQGGGALASATVSAGSITTTSSTNGAYTLNGVGGGTNIVVSAYKNDACTPNSITIPSLDANKQNVNLILNCQCSAGNCNATSNAYCKTNGQWQIYDLSVPSQKQTYCSFPSCAADDSDCVMSGVCVADDASCPLTCSADSTKNNYDADCECSQTANGVCPLLCDMSNDIDCNIYSPVCGDNLVTYPYETCEDAPGAGQLSLCSQEICADPGETGECNCLGLSGCGNLVLDSGEQCEIGMKCANGADCEACVCGTPICVGNNTAPSLTLNFIAATKQIDASWNLLSACKPSVASYSVFKCYKETSTACSSKTEFSVLTITALMNVSDTAVNQNSEYCYFVRTTYKDRPDAESRIECKKTGNYFCMESPPPQFCIDNARTRCDASYNFVTIERCNGSRHCMGPDDAGNTACTNQSVCDTCNHLYGLFSNLDVGISYGDGSTYYCHPESGSVVEGCYLDRTKTLFSAFNYCANIVSCYDYKSYGACTDSTDPCGKNGRGSFCEWAWLDSGKHELGGLCRPVNPTLQKCELCDDEKYNWLSPGCSPQVCALFGQCYFQGYLSSNPNAKSCSKQVTAMCFNYASQQDCTGGVPVAIDAIYANGKRVSGTNALTPSHDKLNLGKCYWQNQGASGGTCFRNADNNPADDCFKTSLTQRDYYCESDFTSPVTTILPSTFGVYPANANIKFSVSDNYPSDKIKSYSCISTTTCYPNETVNGSAGAYAWTVPVSGTYNLYYYSEDPAKNLETVKHAKIRIDAERPFIDLTEPGNTSTFPTNQLEVVVKGITSTDSMYVCAKNTKLNKVMCINNCALTGNKAPCFSDITGEFTFTIVLGNNTNLTGVQFSAQDFAGNTYSNTLLGILLDIEPPKEPLITVSPYSS